MSLEAFLNSGGGARSEAAQAPQPQLARTPPATPAPSIPAAPPPAAPRPNFFDALRTPPPEPEPELLAVADEDEEPDLLGPSWLALTRPAVATLVRPHQAASRAAGAAIPTTSLLEALLTAEADGDGDALDPEAAPQPEPDSEPEPDPDPDPDPKPDPESTRDPAPEPELESEPERALDPERAPEPEAPSVVAASFSFGPDADAPQAVVLTAQPNAPQIQIGADVIRPDVRGVEDTPAPLVEVVRRPDLAPRAYGAVAWSGADESFHGPRRPRAEAPDDQDRRRPQRQASFDAALIASALASSPREEGKEVLIARNQRLLPAPGGDFLWRADYTRNEGDLIVRAPRRDPLVVRHFFAADVPPDLATPEGLRLEAGVAAALTATFSDRIAPIPPGQAAAKVTRLTGPAMIKRPGASRRPLQVDEPVAPGDLVETLGDSILSLSFGRAMRVDLCAEARLRIDSWATAYRDDSAIIELSLLRGAFAAIAAMSGSPPLVALRTPAGTISWCDASLVGQVALLGEPSMIALLRRATGLAGTVTLVNGFGSAAFNKAGMAMPLRGHHAPGDPYPLTDHVLARAAFAALLPSKRVDELERRAAAGL